MQKNITLVLSPKDASDEKYYFNHIVKKTGVTLKRIKHIQINNRSIDARNRKVKINLQLTVFIDELPPQESDAGLNFFDVSNKEPVVIVGSGPAGLFAALKLIENNIKPIVIERGKDVKSRKRDIALIHKNILLDSDSNYAFGEGGAGTFSDGKLFTRSKKRGNIKDILKILKLHGAADDILIDTHPHIGSDKLPDIIKNIRNTIIHYGGEVLFETKLTVLIISGNHIKGIKTQKGDIIKTKAVILATGHSARDIYELLHRQNILLEAKPFAMGVRIEHSQHLIDSIQYSCQVRSEYLPAAAYNLVQQISNRGVYSFCMCPGGVIVPASTSPNEMVVNGMSPSHRNTKWANSAIVVEIHLDDIDYKLYEDALKGLHFQHNYEKLAFANGGKGQIAPAQRMVDFVTNKISNTLPESSFRPGLQSSAMHEWIPENIKKYLQQGLKAFDNKMRGFFTNEAVIIGVESRTSSPIRIPRDKDTFMHLQINGLFPAGEGAGYAGGIISSAVDGQNCAVKTIEFIKK
jgi:uncharacterized FAD-dependent dehydrogenase